MSVGRCLDKRSITGGFDCSYMSINFGQSFFTLVFLKETISSLLPLFVPVPLINVVNGGRVLGEVVEFPILLFELFLIMIIFEG